MVEARSDMAAQVCVAARGVLFDMDGVLVSSIGSVERCWRRWAKLYEVPGAEDYTVPHGVRAIDIVRSLKPEYTEEQVIEGLRVIEEMEVEDTGDLMVFEGAKTLLERLPKDRWAIVTSATKRLMVARLKAAGLPVPELVISGDMVQRGKPDPEPYRRGAELLGIPPSECIVVEDAPSGVGAGLAAGCRVLAVLSTHTADELERATWVTRSLDAIEVRVSDDRLELRFHDARAE